jgi:hypothetical protein
MKRTAISALLLGSVLALPVQAGPVSQRVDYLPEPVVEDPVAAPTSATVTLTVHELLYVTKLAEVRKIFDQICMKELQAFRSTGAFVALPPTSWGVPALDPYSVTAPAWNQLGIFPAGSLLHYRYRVDASGSGANARFTAIAEGDLDGDAVRSLLNMNGSVGADGWPHCTEADGYLPLE